MDDSDPKLNRESLNHVELIRFMKFPLKTMTHLNFSGILEIFKLSIVKRELKSRYRIYFTNCHEEKEKRGILLPRQLFLSIIVTRLSARIFIFNHFRDEISNENEISERFLELFWNAGNLSDGEETKKSQMNF